VIGENFLQLNVLLKQMYPTVVEDRPVMNSDKLMASIGGILSIWLGLSAMFLVEIIELIVCIVRERFLISKKVETETEHPP